MKPKKDLKEMTKEELQQEKVRNQTMIEIHKDNLQGAAIIHKMKVSEEQLKILSNQQKTLSNQTKLTGLMVFATSVLALFSILNIVVVILIDINNKYPSKMYLSYMGLILAVSEFSIGGMFLVLSKLNKKK